MVGFWCWVWNPSRIFMLWDFLFWGFGVGEWGGGILGGDFLQF